jgi:hypothetical protein
MKKWLVALGVAAAVSAACVSVSAKEWKYNDALTIDMSDVEIKIDANGHETCTFYGVEKIPGGTNEYTYVYDVTARTIQIKNMEQRTDKLHYSTSFNPLPIDSANEVVRERGEMAQRVYNMAMSQKKKK